ncbi:MAG: hypothetical protein MZV70_39775 [Desulfobacterales bacterium]|nr:hypothetical protein [Desulfobacterales bacterium]
MATGVTEFARPEDGHWDTTEPERVLLGDDRHAAACSARLYKFTPRLAQQPGRRHGSNWWLDAACAHRYRRPDRHARSTTWPWTPTASILIQEDPGNSAYIAKTLEDRPGHRRPAVQIFESGSRHASWPGATGLPHPGRGEFRGHRGDRHRQGCQLVRAGAALTILGNTQAHYAIPGEPGRKAASST